MILEFDAVLNQAEEILNKSHILCRNSHTLPQNEKNRLEQFSRTIRQNFPKFSAARFFGIDKSTILSMLGTIITFFIIMIQFYNTGC